MAVQDGSGNRLTSSTALINIAIGTNPGGGSLAGTTTKAAIESVELLGSCTNAFVDFCAIEMEANPEACKKQVEWSMAMVTSLNPLIGYNTAAEIAKKAFKVGVTVRDLCLDMIKKGTLKKKDSDVVVTEEELNKALDPFAMTEPA